ncbi:MAG TPA: YraN family protein [Chitinophagales bacterium]|nr:YraN family protein [Chitinophagales bacterium]
MTEHINLGKQGEKAAYAFLRKKGYEMLATNYRFEKTEIDIICRKHNTIVFVEVKTRTSEMHGNPEEAVDARKQEKIVRAAERFIQSNDMLGDVRFDVISVIIDGKKKEKITHITDAFFPYQE